MTHQGDIRACCKTCCHTSNAANFIGAKSTFHVKQHFTCTTEELVYAIRCTKCSDIYIGGTERRLADRFRELSLFAKKGQVENSTVAQYFNLAGYAFNHMEVIEVSYPRQSTYKRKLLEKKLICKLGTTIPILMNTVEH